MEIMKSLIGIEDVITLAAILIIIVIIFFSFNQIIMKVMLNYQDQLTVLYFNQFNYALLYGLEDGIINYTLLNDIEYRQTINKSIDSAYYRSFVYESCLNFLINGQEVYKTECSPKYYIPGFVVLPYNSKKLVASTLMEVGW